MPELMLSDRIADKLPRKSIVILKDEYIKYLKDNPFPAIKDTNYSVMLDKLKRRSFLIGPYTGITIFEAANRIASDLTLIEGILNLFESKHIPTTAEVLLRLGTMQEKGKGDFSVFSEDTEIQGEGFDVAPSFFKNKLYKTLSKWKGDNSLKYIVFNRDCLEDSSCKTYFDNQQKMHKGIIFLGVKSWHK